MPEGAVPPLRTLAREFARTSPPLLLATVAAMALLAVSLTGLAIDERTITGVPAWLKPAKFGISIAIYCATFAWLLSYLRKARPRFVRVVGWVIAVAFLVEIAGIGVQAARGTTSHFNIATPFDTLVFNAMGIFIFVMWVASLATLWALWRTPIADAPMARAMRAGLAIMLAGSVLSAAPMLRPTPAQLAELAVPGGARITGAHTVGAPDGGPGLPVTNWSTTHGDLRVSHFLALHAIQFLPLLALILARLGRPAHDRARLRVLGVAAWSFAALVAITLWQALRGEALIAPSGAVLAGYVAWLVVTASGLALALSSSSTRALHPTRA